MLEIIRWSTFLATAVLAFVGYLDQLRLIFMNQSTAGLSFIMIMLAFWSWTSYTLYGLVQKDYKIFWPNLIGTIFIALILLSFFIF